MGEVNSFGMDLHELDALLSHVEIIVDRDPDADFLNAAFSLGDDRSGKTSAFDRSNRDGEIS